MKDPLIKISKFKSDERGFSFAIIFLLILPLLVFLMISSSQITRTKRTTNETLQQALSNAVNDAAHMVDKESQAMGEPRIDYERAYNCFMESLNYNLSLTDGSPGEESSISGDLTYWLLIYNGDDKYKGYKGGKVASYAYFTNENGYYENISNGITGFPHNIDISPNGFVSGSGVSTTIDSPSVVAIVTTNISSIIGKENNEKVTRWAMAKIIKKGKQ